MKFVTFSIAVVILVIVSEPASAQNTWIRINQLGYQPKGIKVAVWCSKGEPLTYKKWQLVEAGSEKIVFSANTAKPSGAYGPFSETVRLNFSSFSKPGKYFLLMGKSKSPVFDIGEDVYKGTADFCLRYMRQQRSKFNPVLKDSCHTRDGYTLYGPMPDSTFIDVSGGWHDATDYLQYSSTSANATFQLLAAYRDFPGVFLDQYQANGLEGSNQIPDVLDEARWGLDWLLKMHPQSDWMFNQVGDDRDHLGFRMPQGEKAYGRGFERPVYFVSGDPQMRGKYMNTTTGTSSIAGKFSSAFSLGAEIYQQKDTALTSLLYQKALSAFAYGLKKPGYTQTASVKAPYIYGEENWTDDMELAAAMLNGTKLDYAFELAQKEHVTPWIINDTAAHYQWYPFINAGHYELSKHLDDKRRKAVIDFYKQGIEIIWNKARTNAFYRAIPFIWCSNNFTTAFTIQCYWYRQLSGDTFYNELEQANFDWLFGCNPWGTSMVYGLPAWGDTPVDPHASFLKIGGYPIDGGLVDGPVKGSIFNNLLGITLTKPDEYAQFQSNLAVYHDDSGDFSTNEPTMDGTASLIYLLASKEANTLSGKKTTASVPANHATIKNVVYNYGGIIRGDTAQKNMALVFTGDEFGEGGDFIAETLDKEKVTASFFFTGNFYRNPAFKNLIRKLKTSGNYLGAHSDKHLLYCDWNNRDSLLVSKVDFKKDLLGNYEEMKRFGVSLHDARYFLPAYEWYNDSISIWTNDQGLELVNFSPGTISKADYTTPDMKNYRSSDTIMQSILKFEQTRAAGLNGFILLLHIGTDKKRTDKMYYKLPELISYLKRKHYSLVSIDELLQ